MPEISTPETTATIPQTCAKCHGLIVPKEITYLNPTGNYGVICGECYRKNYQPSLLQPNCGACSQGHTPFCQACKDHLQHDVDHLIAFELNKMALPDGPEWRKLHDYLTLRRGQDGIENQFSSGPAG